MTVTHHTVFEATDAAARQLMAEFQAQCASSRISFITHLLATRKIDHDAPGEAVYGVGSTACSETEWTAKGRDYTLWLDEDLPEGKNPYVLLIENRPARTTLNKAKR